MMADHDASSSVCNHRSHNPTGHLQTSQEWWTELKIAWSGSRTRETVQEKLKIDAQMKVNVAKGNPD